MISPTGHDAANEGNEDQNNGQTGDADGQAAEGDKSAGYGGDAAGSGVGAGAAEPAVTTEVEASKQEEPKPPAEPDLSEFDLDEWRGRGIGASPDRLTTSVVVKTGRSMAIMKIRVGRSMVRQCVRRARC